MLKKIYNVLAKIAGFLGGASAVGYIIIILVTTVNVILKLWTKQFAGEYEIVQLFMIFSVFASFAYGQTTKTHINMPLIIEKLPRVLRNGLFGFLSLVSTGTCALLTYGAYSKFMVAYASFRPEVTGVLRIPYWPFYIVEIVACGFFCLILLLDTIIIFAGIKSKEYDLMTIKEYNLNVKGVEIEQTEEEKLADAMKGI
jgi:TRAP-type C4-dicarboxylate transport system permease small subunit